VSDAKEWKDMKEWKGYRCWELILTKGENVVVWELERAAHTVTNI